MRFSAAADGWVEIRESLQTISISGATIPEIIEIPLPLRFGSHWLKVRRGDEFQVKRVYSPDADGDIFVAVHCSESPDLQRRIEWLRQAGRIASRVVAQSDAQTVAQLLEETRTLAARAADAAEAALARHLRAQALVINERYADGAEAFATAEAAWNEAGNKDGALAARLGRVSALLQSGKLAAVLELTTPASGLRHTETYLFTRLEHERCLALGRMARLDEAAGCFAWTLKNYRVLRERREIEIERQAYAGILVEKGEFGAAQRLGEQGVREASGPFAAAIRGRNLLLLADIALRRGDIARSLHHLNGALDEFTVFKSAQWQANVYLKLADLYSEIGSLDEAYAALSQASVRLDARNLPARVATAILTLAELERRSGRTAAALLWARAAETMFAGLNMPDPADSAQLLRVSLQISDGIKDDKVLGIPSIETVPAEDVGKWRIERARLAIARGLAQDARNELARLAGMPLMLGDQTQATLLNAALQAASGGDEPAQRLLREAAERIRALAQRARSEVLRYVIARQDQELRRTGLRLALERRSTEAVAVDTAWSWFQLQAESGTAVHPERGSAPGDDAFDRAVASDLLVASADRNSAAARPQRELLARLAGPDGEARQIRAPMRLLTVAQFQQTLQTDAAFIAYVDGGSRGALIWLTRDEARLLPAPAPARVHADAVTLQAATKDAAASLDEIRSAARTLSDDLFGGLEARPAPQRLYVLADPILRGVPWSVVAWPGTAAPLLETTAVAAIRLSREKRPSRAAAPARPAELRVVVSAQRDAATPALPVLAGAEVEAEQIRGASAGNGLRVSEDARATRASVEEALARPGGWVHVAAHGVAEPQRIGYAGLWLEPAAPETTPAFLSWIDVLDQGVRSDLVVLDACQTGDSGTAINGNLSFADAVSRAGARRVVAVMWPVSDAASANWAPAFYANIAADAELDAAEALRAAQLQLRASRAFSHPFYWAGMQAIERWPVGAPDAH